jgi:predicted nucleotidyltransferase
MGWAFSRDDATLPRFSRAGRASPRYEMTEPATSPIDDLADALATSWPSLRSARERARTVREEAAAAVEPLVSSEDMSVVVFGSLARDELTSGSDADWTLLIDGQASARHFDVSRKIRQSFDAIGLNAPGPEGTFGGLAFSHEILHRIGGGEDSNRNLTQRILLLLESAAVGSADAHERVVRGVIDRYVTEDPGWQTKTVTVPRFLLNDIARYWRTVAVDFGHKRRERASAGWALRTVKLRLSRKLTYASGLLVCFSCTMGAEVRDADDRSTALADHLLRLLSRTPLERVAHIVLRHQLHEAGRRVFDSYERFLALLDDEDLRETLKHLPQESAATSVEYASAREIGRDFQRALNDIFFGAGDTEIPSLTQKYAVF